MNETEETRQFVAAVLEEDGRASTSEIRQRTDLTEGQIHHQYRKLERHGYIEIERTAIPSQSGVRMKIAVIPEAKRQQAESLLTHDRQPKRTTVDVVDLAEQVEGMADSIEQMQEYVGENVYRQMIMMRWVLARAEVALEETGVDLDSIDGVELRDAELRERATEFGGRS